MNLQNKERRLGTGRAKMRMMQEGDSRSLGLEVPCMSISFWTSLAWKLSGNGKTSGVCFQQQLQAGGKCRQCHLPEKPRSCINPVLGLGGHFVPPNTTD